jgi:hypothetical protein
LLPDATYFAARRVRAYGGSVVRMAPVGGRRQAPSPTGTANSSGGSFRHSATYAEVKVDHVFPLADKILAWLEQKGGEQLV